MAMSENSHGTENVESKKSRGKRWIAVYKVDDKYILTAHYDVDYNPETFFTEMRHPYTVCKDLFDVVGYVESYLRD